MEESTTYLSPIPADILTMTMPYLDFHDQKRAYLSHTKNSVSRRLDSIWQQYWMSRISNGKIVSGQNLMFTATEFGHLELLEHLLKKKPELDPTKFYSRSMSPFHSAVKYQQINVVDYLLKCKRFRNLNINTIDLNGLTALHYAVGNRDKEMVTLLLNRGADSFTMSESKSRKLSPIGLAVLKDQEDIIRLLHRHKIDLTWDCAYSWEPNDIRLLPPLHYASVNGKLPIVEILLNCGVDPNSDAPNRTTPLHAIVQCSLNNPWRWLFGTNYFLPRILEVIEILIQRGADITAENLDHKRPIDLLIRRKQMDSRVYELLTPKLQ